MDIASLVYSIESLSGLSSVLFDVIFLEPVMLFDESKKMSISSVFTDYVEILVVCEITVERNDIVMF